MHGGAVGDSDARFGERVGINRHLHAAFPLLLPLIHNHPVLIRCERLRVGQLHRTNEIFAKQLGGRFRRRAIVDLEVVVGPPCQGGRLFFLLRRRPLKYTTLGHSA